MTHVQQQRLVRAVQQKRHAQFSLAVIVLMLRERIRVTTQHVIQIHAWSLKRQVHVVQSLQALVVLMIQLLRRVLHLQERILAIAVSA
jgi:hypothetical protein